jgi:hypothetical protein
MTRLVVGCDELPAPERTFDVREAGLRYALYDFKRGLLPVLAPAELDAVDAEQVVIRHNNWVMPPRDEAYYTADLRALKDGKTEFVARLTPRKDIVVRALARIEAQNRAAGIAFLAGELANTTPGSDRERSSREARAKFFGTKILPPERDPLGLANQVPRLDNADAGAGMQ